MVVWTVATWILTTTELHIQAKLNTLRTTDLYKPRQSSEQNQYIGHLISEQGKFHKGMVPKTQFQQSRLSPTKFDIQNSAKRNWPAAVQFANSPATTRIIRPNQISQHEPTSGHDMLPQRSIFERINFESWVRLVLNHHNHLCTNIFFFHPVWHWSGILHLCFWMSFDVCVFLNVIKQVQIWQVAGSLCRRKLDTIVHRLIILNHTVWFLMFLWSFAVLSNSNLMFFFRLGCFLVVIKWKSRSFNRTMIFLGCLSSAFTVGLGPYQIISPTDGEGCFLCEVK